MTDSPLTCYECGRLLTILHLHERWYIYCPGGMGVRDFTLDDLSPEDTLEDAVREHKRLEREWLALFGE